MDHAKASAGHAATCFLMLSMLVTASGTHSLFASTPRCDPIRGVHRCTRGEQGSPRPPAGTGALRLRGGAECATGPLLYTHPALGGLAAEGEAEWKISTTASRFLEVADEPRHKTVFLNEYCRAMEAQVAEGTGRTQWHRHATDSVYIFLADGGYGSVDAVTGANGAVSLADTTENPVRKWQLMYGAHGASPKVHAGWCLAGKGLFHCIDLELYAPPPRVRPLGGAAPMGDASELLLDVPGRCRVHRVTISSARARAAEGARELGLYGLFVAMTDGVFGFLRDGVAAERAMRVGEVAWLEPCGRFALFGEALEAAVVELTRTAEDGAAGGACA